MIAFRGLARATILCRRNEARCFLGWLGERATREELSSLTLHDVDAYMKHWASSLRRISLKDVAGKMRSFLRWLHMAERTPRDLSRTVIASSIYAHEGIPCAIGAEDVRRVLAVAQDGHTAKGLRDYAILTLLSSYGVRAGEIVALRLNDVDWRKETVRICHSKTGATTHLPLLPEAGEAVLQYLQKSRPKTHFRELFLRSKAPYRPFTGGGALHGLVHIRLKAAGVSTDGQARPSYFPPRTSRELVARGGANVGDRRSPGPSVSRFNAGLSEARVGRLARRGYGDSDWSESMTPVSASPGPRQYVQQLQLRSPLSSRNYRCLLNGFHRFVAEQATDRSISRVTVRQWLVDQDQAWSLNMLTDRARALDHYLDWMVAQNLLAKNPLAELRREYGQWATRPVVKALLRPDFEAALEALRPLPRFGSTLGQVMRDHVLLMQSMGYRYNNGRTRDVRSSQKFRLA